MPLTAIGCIKVAAQAQPSAGIVARPGNNPGMGWIGVMRGAARLILLNRRSGTFRHRLCFRARTPAPLRHILTDKLMLISSVLPGAHRGKNWTAACDSL